jgi:hypothetical protein
MTGIDFGWIAWTSVFASVLRKAKRSFVVSLSLTFRTEVQFTHEPAKQASGRVLSRANQMSPPAALLNSLNDVKGTTHRCSVPYHRAQCLLAMLRMLVVPPSGSIRSSCLKSNSLPLDSILAARFCVASSIAFDDDGKRTIQILPLSTDLHFRMCILSRRNCQLHSFELLLFFLERAERELPGP